MQTLPLHDHEKKEEDVETMENIIVTIIIIIISSRNVFRYLDVLTLVNKLMNVWATPKKIAE